MLGILPLVVILSLTLVTLCSTKCGPVGHRQTKYARSIYLKRILSNYDKRVPPNFNGGAPTVIRLSIFVNSLDDISETNMQCRMTLMIRQTWEDARLKFGHLCNDSSWTLDANMAEKIWVPDLFFNNEKRAHFHEVTVPNKLLRIYSNGTVYYSIRVSVVLSCPMKLHTFPLDTQVCTVQLESYAYTTSMLHLRWQNYKPVLMSEQMELPQFRLHNTSTGNCTKYYEAGAFPCIQADFILKRDVCYHLIQTYIPTAMIVILSWVSFWINIDAIPARISLGVLTILTMTTMSSGTQRALPRVSYVKAIDVWMAACLCFVFSALLEFAVVNVLSRKEEKLAIPTPSQALEMEPMLTMKKDTVVTSSERQTRWKSGDVDKLSRKVFPTFFILFNFTYWTVYIIWTS